MNNEVLKNYFTDQQVAAIKGMTLGGLRNNIYRHKIEDLPPMTQATKRGRLWNKEAVRAWLLKRFNNDTKTVDGLMLKGEEAGLCGSLQPAVKNSAQ